MVDQLNLRSKCVSSLVLKTLFIVGWRERIIFRKVTILKEEKIEDKTYNWQIERLIKSGFSVNYSVPNQYS